MERHFNAAGRNLARSPPLAAAHASVSRAARLRDRGRWHRFDGGVLENGSDVLEMFGRSAFLIVLKLRRITYSGRRQPDVTAFQQSPPTVFKAPRMERIGAGQSKHRLYSRSPLDNMECPRLAGSARLRQRRAAANKIRCGKEAGQLGDALRES